MKKIVLFLGIFMLLAGTSAFAEEMFKIGVVDLPRALNESDQGKKAKTELETMIKAKQTSIDEKGKALEKAKTDLEKQSSVLSQDARKTKEEELERLIRDYQRLVTDSQNEVKKKEGDVTGDILKELRAIIQKIGQDEGYTLILESAEGQILYTKKDLDLTDLIIKKYNDSPARTKK